MFWLLCKLLFTNDINPFLGNVCFNAKNNSNHVLRCVVVKYPLVLVLKGCSCMLSYRCYSEMFR